MIFRGSMIPPKYEHGDRIAYGYTTGVIHHRRHNGRSWEYGLLIEGFIHIVWVRET